MPCNEGGHSDLQDYAGEFGRSVQQVPLICLISWTCNSILCSTLKITVISDTAHISGSTLRIVKNSLHHDRFSSCCHGSVVNCNKKSCVYCPFHTVSPCFLLGILNALLKASLYLFWCERNSLYFSCVYPYD